MTIANMTPEEIAKFQSDYEAGNYDAAYNGWNSNEETFHPAYILGFYSSYELDEIPDEGDRDAVETARVDWAARLDAMGIAQ